MRSAICFLFLVLLASYTGNVSAGSATSKLSVLADTLIAEYAAKAGSTKTTIAVFPFNCEEKLQKQRVGFAASEVMSHRFVASAAFTVVERGEIGRLLSEQRLQSSGAVDSDTAVKLGKVLGAGIILLGNIQKVDGKYQVNTRLVNAETSAVLVSAYEELAVSAFEDDARVYLNLLPEEQTIGIYFLYNKRPNSNALPIQSFNDFSGTHYLYPKAFNLALMGVGLRYFPISKMLVDVSYMGSAAGVQAADGGLGDANLKITAIRALLGMKFSFSRKLAYYIGAGATSYSLVLPNKTTYATPTAYFRLEFLPQSRVGISLSGDYDFHNEPAVQNLFWASPPVVLKTALV